MRLNRKGNKAIMLSRSDLFPLTIKLSSHVHSSRLRQPRELEDLHDLQIHAGLDDNGNGQPLQFLHSSQQDHHLLLAATEDTVRLFDVRSPGKAAASLKPHSSQPLVQFGSPMHPAHN